MKLFVIEINNFVLLLDWLFKHLHLFWILFGVRDIANLSFEFIGIYETVLFVSGQNMPDRIGLYPILLGESVQL